MNTNINNTPNTLTPDMMKKAGAVETALHQAKANRKPYSVLYNPEFDTYYVEAWYPGQFEAAKENYFLTVSDSDARQLSNDPLAGKLPLADGAIKIASVPQFYQSPTCIYYKGAHYDWRKVKSQVDETILATVHKALPTRNQNNLQCLFDLYVGAHAFVHGEEFVIKLW